MEAWINMFLTDALIRASLLSVLWGLSVWSQTGIDSLRVSWQVGLAAGQPACLSTMSATLDAPSSVFHSTKFTGDKHGKNLLILCSMPICLLCKRSFLFFFLSQWVCLFLSSYQKSFFYLSSFSLLHKSSPLLFPPFNVLCMRLPHVCCFSFIVVFLLLFSQAVILSWTLSTCTGSFCSPAYSCFTSSHLLLEVALSFTVDDASYKVDPVNVLVNVLSLLSCVTSQLNVLQREVYAIASGCSINTFSTF